MNPTQNQHCNHCGNALPVDAPQGLCPRCLGALNLDAETVAPASEMAASRPPLTPAELAPHFPQLEILACMGRGGMGVVYRARQKTLNRIVALKLVAPERAQDAKFAERFTREAQALARLSHPNIVTVHDFGQAGGFYYLLMEFVDGVSLRQLLQGGRLSPREALSIVPQICDALQYAHDHGIVHRDIKPENILIDRQGRLKVADFGLAKLVDHGSPDGDTIAVTAHWPHTEAPAINNVAEHAPGMTQDLTEAGKVIGTPHYMAPEQLAHPADVDHRADIYALGVVFYQILTGELPGQPVQPPSKRVRLDVRLDEVVLRALEQEPERRYRQVSEMKTCLETIAKTTSDATSMPGTRNDSSWTNKRRLAAFLGMIIVGGLSAFLLLRNNLVHQARAPEVTRVAQLPVGPEDNPPGVGIRDKQAQDSSTSVASNPVPDFVRAVSVFDDLIAVESPMFLYYRDTNRMMALTSAERWLDLAQAYNHWVMGSEVLIPTNALREMAAVIAALKTDHWEDAFAARLRFEDTDWMPRGALLLYYGDRQEAIRTDNPKEFAEKPPVEMAMTVPFNGTLASGMFIDFDTGQQYRLPAEVDVADRKSVAAWVEKMGIDAEACIVNDWGILTNWGLTVIELAPSSILAQDECAIALRHAQAYPSPGRLGPPPGTNWMDIPSIAFKRYAIRTREGGIGWLSMDLSQRKGPRFQYRLRERITPENAARLRASQSIPSVRFGPIVERTVTANSTGPLDRIDLISGKIVETPAGVDPDPAALSRWMDENDGDYSAVALENTTGLYGFNLRLIPVASEAWHELPAMAVGALTSHGPVWYSRLIRTGSRWPRNYPNPPGYGPMSSDEARQWMWPDTHLFRTRKGCAGILQILGPTSQPRGIAIRYKLVVPAETAPATPREVAAEWLRQAKARNREGAMALTTGSGQAGWVCEVTDAPEFDLIRPVRQLGNQDQALVDTTPFRKQAGTTNVFYAILFRRDGRWLIDRYDMATRDETDQLMRGVLLNPGVKFDLPAREWVGRWIGPCLEFELLADGNGAWLVIDPSGPLSHPKPFRWAINRSTLVIQESQKETKLEIAWMEDNLIQLSDSEGQRGTVLRHKIQ